MSSAMAVKAPNILVLIEPLTRSEMSAMEDDGSPGCGCFRSLGRFYVKDRA
jgi:hypothetical protein